MIHQSQDTDTPTAAVTAAQPTTVTPTVPHQPSKDSLDLVNVLARLIKAGYAVALTAECVRDDGTEVRVMLSPHHRQMVRISTVANGIHSNFRYQGHHVVDGVQRPFDIQSATEYAINESHRAVDSIHDTQSAVELLSTSTMWELTR